MALNARTRFPLVLVHGLLGFVRVAGYPYWFGIDSALRRHGVQVFLPRVSAVHCNELRGEQLLEQIPAILANSGAERVHLIGHSQGALTARYVAARRPEWVASVTSVAGPNQGSELADYLQLKLGLDTPRERLFRSAIEGVAKLMDRLDRRDERIRLPQDVLASRQALTQQGVAAFNAKYPQGLPEVWGGEGPEEVNGVRYYSWSGTLQPATDRGGNRFDASHALCRRLSRCFQIEKGQNDGMVGRFSSHLGKVIRSDYPLDHLDIINQTAGAVGQGIDPVALFVEHAARLREAGL
ncbi:esterase/lipase family protein [Pseudomonas indica]|uniref:esterase/lipase family protein n=1 Tax=Pseudomonas indica TaxID=137658 RepID=UPI000BAB5426|nr:triacylglycerol lipase [Pseudomonas indica]MBU3058149.1 triacylglycerol lipase [Pseudomonas indica]PAU64267.1 alpha/beta hydrolase [Pseudomonas indica]